MTVDDACDYIIIKTSEEGHGLSLLKLQKLLYYVQAWHLAFYDKPMFPGRFQAWVHGPVNRGLYDRFKDSKSLYSDVDARDVRTTFDLGSLSEGEMRHIDSVLEAYAGLTGTQLEEMTHKEEPWAKARVGYAPSARCEQEIDEALMAAYYKQRL